MGKKLMLSVDNLSDEQVLKEFVKRFGCDGAILFYLNDNEEFGFGRWKNQNGKKWVSEFFKIIKDKSLPKMLS